MSFFRLVVKNLLRHKLRVTLTVLGIGVVILTFGLLETMVKSWRAEADAAVPDRLITRHAIAFTIQVPMSYADRILSVPGVTNVTYANWFGGRYKDGKTFFAKFAVEPASYLTVHPEIVLTPQERAGFLQDRRACIVGRKLAEEHGWAIGDRIPIIGTIYPGNWEFVIRGIYRGANPTIDESDMYVHWALLDERRRLDDPDQAGTVGWLVTQIADPQQAAHTARAIDQLFANSLAETRTETEGAFQAGFVAMSGALISGVEMLAFLIVGISLLILANAMVMVTRERTREYAVMKTMGFRPSHIMVLVTSEACVIAAIGGAFGMALTIPACWAYATYVKIGMGSVPLAIALAFKTLALSVLVTGLVGILAPFVPALQAARLPVTTGLRHVG